MHISGIPDPWFALFSNLTLAIWYVYLLHQILERCYFWARFWNNALFWAMAQTDQHCSGIWCSTLGIKKLFWKLVKIFLALIVFYKINTEIYSNFDFTIHSVIFSQNRFKVEKIFHLREDCNFEPVLWLNH